MTRKSLLPLATLTLFAAACAPGVTVHNDFDHDVAFAQLHTFDWAPAPGRSTTGDPRTTNPFLERRIRQAIEANLQEHGYRKATDAAPDLLIAYYAAVEAKLDVSTVDQYYGWRGPWTRTATEVHQYDEGTLVIDIADARTRRAIWRGWGQGAVTRSSNPATNEQRLRHAVDRILASFPASAGN